MERSRLTILFVLFTLPLASVGCLKCHHTAYRECLRPVEQCEVSALARAKVYVFLMNGADVVDIDGLKELECQIVAAGFPKVYYAQRFDLEWYYRELHRLRRDDPDNRFVLIGQGAGAKQLQELACRVTADGIPLDAVVFHDPIGIAADLASEAEYETFVIRSHLWVGAPKLAASEEMRVSGVHHLHLSDSPTVVATIASILTRSAKQVPIARQPVDCIPLVDENKPIPRPSEPKQVPIVPPEWNVLCPNIGHG